MRLKCLVVFVFLFCVPFSNAVAQSDGAAAVYLKNGRVVEGTVSKADNTVSVRTWSGYVFTYPLSDVKKIVPAAAGSRKPEAELAPTGTVNSLYGFLSLAAPSSPYDFQNYWSTGGGFGGAFGFGINPSTSVVLSAQFASIPLNTAETDAVFYPMTVTGGTIQSFTVLVNGRYVVTGRGSPVDFYVIGGVGPAFISLSPITVALNYYSQNFISSTAGVSETDVSLRFGVGADLSIGNNVSAFAETDGIYTAVSGNIEGDGYITTAMLSVGLKFDMPSAGVQE